MCIFVSVHFHVWKNVGVIDLHSMQINDFKKDKFKSAMTDSYLCRGASATSVTPGGPPGGLGGGTGSCGPGDPTGAGEVLTPKKHEDLMALLVSQPYTSIKYSAYRIAAKLDLMRSAMCLDEVKLGAVANVFHQHGYSQVYRTFQLI